MRILITGASGFIGSHIAASLRHSLADAELLTPGSQHADFKQMHTLNDWLPLLQGVDVVINTVGIIAETGARRFDALHTRAPIALFDACVKAGVKRVIQISALGVDQAVTTYQASKLAADQHLAGLPLQWFILRPSLVYGAGGKSSTMFKRIASLPVIALPSGGKQQLQPVHISDLVAAVNACITSDSSQQIINIVGPTPITLANWLQQMRTVQGRKPALVLSVPFGLTILMAYLLHAFIPLLQPENLRMLQAGNVADPQPMSRLLGRLPLSTTEGMRL